MSTENKPKQTKEQAAVASSVGFGEPQRWFTMDDMRRMMEAEKRMALAILNDYEPDEAAKFSKTVLSLGFGYRIIRLQDGISKENAVRRPFVPKLLGGPVKHAAAQQACFGKHCLNALRRFNRFFVFWTHKR